MIPNPLRTRLPISREHANALLDMVERRASDLAVDLAKVTVERNALLADFALARAGFYDATVLRTAELLLAEVRRLREDFGLFGEEIRYGLMCLERGETTEAYGYLEEAEAFARQNAHPHLGALPTGVADLTEERRTRRGQTFGGGAA